MDEQGLLAEGHADGERVTLIMTATGYDEELFARDNTFFEWLEPLSAGRMPWYTSRTQGPRQTVNVSLGDWPPAFRDRVRWELRQYVPTVPPDPKPLWPDSIPLQRSARAPEPAAAVDAEDIPIILFRETFRTPVAHPRLVWEGEQTVSPSGWYGRTRVYRGTWTLREYYSPHSDHLAVFDCGVLMVQPTTLSGGSTQRAPLTADERWFAIREVFEGQLGPSDELPVWGEWHAMDPRNFASFAQQKSSSPTPGLVTEFGIEPLLTEVLFKGKVSPDGGRNWLPVKESPSETPWTTLGGIGRKADGQVLWLRTATRMQSWRESHQTGHCGVEAKEVTVAP